MDYSFLRLSDTFEKAKDINNPRLSKLIRFYPIQLSPNQPYAQITSSDTDINLGQDYTVNLIDCEGIEVADITQFVAVDQQTVNGIEQIGFELAPTGVDYYGEPLHLKFTHNSSGQTWFSNHFLLSDYRSEYVTRFDYEQNGELENQNIDQTLFPFKKSISLRCWFDKIAPLKEFSGYKQTGVDREISSRTHYYPGNGYIFEEWDNFTLEAANVMFMHSKVYVNGVRVTSDTNIESEGVIGQTNIFNGAFRLAINPNETYTPTFQIFDDLTIDIVPSGRYTLTSLPGAITVTFNQPIIIGNGTVSVTNALDDSVIAIYTQDDVVPVGNNSFTIPSFSGLITTNGNYNVILSAGFITSVIGQVQGQYTEMFSVTNPDYLAADYKATDYLTEE